MGASRWRRVGVAAASVVIAGAWPLTPDGSADPPYADCHAAHADGRWSIPSSDPAYRPDLDLDGDGLACEPSKGRRSTR